MGGVSSYLYYTTELSEIPIDKNEIISYITERDIKLIKSSKDNYYKIYHQTHFTEKYIPSGTYFTVSKMVKTKDGIIRVLVQFDNEVELIDMTDAFSEIKPLIPKMGWLRNALTTSLFLPDKSTPKKLIPYKELMDDYPVRSY